MELFDPVENSYIKQAKSDWTCCDSTCRTFNKAASSKCSQCSHERCAECQGPNTLSPFITFPYMYICCQCGDGPKLYNLHPRREACNHIVCSSCMAVK
ncbi:hypothetical protein V6Z94_005359 [Aspergillus fumigatus]